MDGEGCSEKWQRHRRGRIDEQTSAVLRRRWNRFFVRAETPRKVAGKSSGLWENSIVGM